MSTDPQARAWLEVRPGALRRNLQRIRESIGDAAAVIPMVKADGYGLGMEDVVRTLESEAPWGFGVATVEEGRRLRGAGVTAAVIIFSPVPPGSYDSAVAHDLTLTLSDLDSVERVAAAAARTGHVGRFHVEVDTGMGRSGFDWRRVAEWGPALADGTPRYGNLGGMLHSLPFGGLGGRRDDSGPVGEIHWGSRAAEARGGKSCPRL